MESSLLDNNVDNIDSVESISAADQKILDDLNVVSDKMDQCQSIFNEQKAGSSGSTATNSVVFSTTHELYDIIGFLETCAPRMVELVEACAQGNTALSDIVLMKALEVNDRLINTLSEFDGVTFRHDTDDADPNNNTTTTQQQTSDDADVLQSTSEDDFDAFLNERTSEVATTNVTTTENDLLS
jgi:hypothetical protein